MPLNMTRSEREAFLADVHVGVLSIERAGHPPLSAPVWYAYDPSRGISVITGEQSLKGRALAAAGRCALVAQTETPPYRYVGVEGPVVETRPTDVETDLRPMARRYLGTEGGDQYVASNPGDQASLTYVIRPDVWRTVDYGKGFGG